MSAFIVSKAHIDALVCASLRPRLNLRWYDAPPEVIDALWGDTATPEEYWASVRRHLHHATYETADHIGRMLWLENLASVAGRYPDDVSGDRPGCEQTDEAIAGYAYPSIPRLAARTPVQVLKLLDCYEYQSCEHAGWRRSAAYQFCQALRKAMISALPGYDEADWELVS